jgi:hypothetical protein
MVDRWSGSESGDASGAVEHAPPAITAEEPAIDRARLDELAELGDEEDPQWLQLILEKFKEDVSARIIKLVVASETGDPVSLNQVAHSLKGSCGNIGAKIGGHCPAAAGAGQERICRGSA